MFEMFRRPHRLFARLECLWKDCRRQRPLNIPLKRRIFFYHILSPKSVSALSLTPTHSLTPFSHLFFSTGRFPSLRRHLAPGFLCDWQIEKNWSEASFLSGLGLHFLAQLFFSFPDNTRSFSSRFIINENLVAYSKPHKKNMKTTISQTQENLRG